MQIYTIQLAKWRKVKLPTLLYDVTLKSGDRRLAPSDSLLWPYKRGEISQAEYVRIFTEEMRTSFTQNKQYWLELIQSDEPIALACYCPEGCFCHRYLLVKMFEKQCEYYKLPFKYLGEIS